VQALESGFHRKRWGEVFPDRGQQVVEIPLLHCPFGVSRGGSATGRAPVEKLARRPSRRYIRASGPPSTPSRPSERA